ncbi:MAG: helix-turn-helix domain-containing protein [Kiritimatiellae bacterium]|nr:helix-turn-helix domain-containing protein [Kiritimatiellia bacterium]
MKQSSIRYEAPALARGIEVLRALEQDGPLTLEGLARAVQAPKSSLLRILNTLIALNLAARDDTDKHYHAQASLVEFDRNPQRFTRRVSQALQRLADGTACTAEWYVPGKSGMVLVQRAVPPRREVRVMARIGFVRPWHGELEAVSCLAAAWHGRQARAAGWWAYVRDGVEGKLAAKLAAERVASARRLGHAADEHFNTHGVRRMACVVLEQNELAGIVALAENFMPEGDASRPARLRALANAAAGLCENTAFTFEFDDKANGERSLEK